MTTHREPKNVSRSFMRMKSKLAYFYQDKKTWIKIQERKSWKVYYFAAIRSIRTVLWLPLEALDLFCPYPYTRAGLHRQISPAWGQHNMQMSHYRASNIGLVPTPGPGLNIDRCIISWRTWSSLRLSILDLLTGPVGAFFRSKIKDFLKHICI